MIHCCNGLYRPDRVLHLCNNQGWHKRRVEILNECPNCGAKIAVLYETRLADNYKSSQRYKNHKADQVLEKSMNELWYEYHQSKYGTKNNVFWKYGENKEIHDTKGNLIEIRQRAVNFNGSKELIGVVHIKGRGKNGKK